MDSGAHGIEFLACRKLGLESAFQVQRMSCNYIEPVDEFEGGSTPFTVLNFAIHGLGMSLH